MISESRCRAKLHGIFKHAQRQSRDGRFSCCWSDLISVLVAKLHGYLFLGIVVLSGVLSPGFDLYSSIVRNVLRGWITHGDIAAVWVTQPLALSTVSCLLEACQQANVVWSLRGTPQRHGSSVVCALCQQKPCLSASAGGFVRFWLPTQETFDVVFSQRSSAFEAGSTV